MTNREIGIQLGKLALEERRITNEILKLISLGEDRRAYLEHGYASMFDWLVEGLGFSHASAQRRIDTARFIKGAPDAASKLESGKVNLTTLSKAQSAIRAQEKATGHKVSSDMKVKILEKIENKSAFQAEQILCSLLPESTSHIRRETQVVIDENTTRRSMNFTNEMNESLKRAKEVLSHKFPNATDAEILAYALEVLLNKFDPLRKPVTTRKLATDKSTSAAETKFDTPKTATPAINHENPSSRVMQKAAISKARARRVILKSTNGSCAFRDPVSDKLCGSRYQIQIDHIIPKALGGTDDLINLRPLCRLHNLLAAEKIFGRGHMEQFRQKKE